MGSSFKACGTSRSASKPKARAAFVSTSTIQGKLFEDGQVAAAVTEGKAEIGHVNLSRYAETILVADAYYLPFLFTDVAVERASRAPESEIRRLIEDAILEKAGARVLWWIPEGSILLLTKDVAVANPTALGGKSVRISGPTIAQTVRLCGGVPKDVAANQQPKAYATGVVDVGMTSITAVMARGLYRSMNTITRTGHAASNFVVVVNEKYWRSLTDGQRGLLEGAAHIADKEAARIASSSSRTPRTPSSRGRASRSSPSPDGSCSSGASAAATCLPISLPRRGTLARGSSLPTAACAKTLVAIRSSSASLITRA